jgi:glutamate-1-semialdehyde 2,1-aminomutase
MMAPPSYNKSKSYTRRARDCEALIEARPSLFFSGYEPVQGYPTFVRTARGAYLWDVDGNKYIDLLLGYGSVILGHGHPSVRRAVVDALDEL